GPGPRMGCVWPRHPLRTQPDGRVSRGGGIRPASGGVSFRLQKSISPNGANIRVRPFVFPPVQWPTMTVTSPPETKPTRKDFNPDDFRMTVGAHLEELRGRTIVGLGGDKD